jgi:arginine decarboxylase-like protein
VPAAFTLPVFVFQNRAGTTSDDQTLAGPKLASNARKVLEVFHDATFDKDRSRQYFNSGVLSLRERARRRRSRLQGTRVMRGFMSTALAGS